MLKRLGTCDKLMDGVSLVLGVGDTGSRAIGCNDGDLVSVFGGATKFAAGVGVFVS